MAYIKPKQYDDPLSGDQMLTLLTSIGKEYFTPPSLELNAVSDPYMDSLKKSEESYDTQRKRSVRDAVQNADSVDSAYGDVEKVFKEAGDIDSLTKLGEIQKKRKDQQEEEDLQNKISELDQQGKTLEEITNEVQKYSLGHGDINTALKLKTPSSKKHIQFGNELLEVGDDGSIRTLRTKKGGSGDGEDYVFVKGRDNLGQEIFEPVKVGSKEHAAAIVNGKPTYDSNTIAQEKAALEKSKSSKPAESGDGYIDSFLKSIGNLVGATSNTPKGAPTSYGTKIGIVRRRGAPLG